MTDTEKQAIIDAVISSLRTNSRTIEQLTPVTQLSSEDYFEVNGGRRIAYAILVDLIYSNLSTDLSNLQTAIDKKELQSVSITTTQDTATLTINSVGKTIQCSVPIASSSQSGLLTPAILAKIKEDIDAVSDTFEKFVGEVSLEDLDNMTSVRYATGQLPSFYKVIFSGMVVGLLLIYSDAGSHELTQELHTTMILQNGAVNGTHVDGAPHILTRSYDIGSHQWSPWRDKSSFVTLSEEEYDSLTAKDPDTYYFIYE